MINNSFFKNHAVCDTMWKNAVQLARSLMTIHVHFIVDTQGPPPHTHARTHTQNTCFSTATIFARMHLNVTSRVHCLF